jgi:hypothetical protein
VKANPNRTQLVTALTLVTLFQFLISTLQLPLRSEDLSKRNSPVLGQAFAKLPMSFEVNEGQSDDSVKFLARGHGYGLFLTSTEAVLVFSKAPDRQAVVRMQLRGANTQPGVSGEDELPGKSNYFEGNDPAQWHNGVSTYGKVRYTGVYSGIDLIYYGNGQQLEYDFVVSSGVDPAAIRLAFDGGRPAEVDREGNLVLETGTEGDAVLFRKPVAYQVVMGSRREVAAEYVVSAGREVSFRLGAYDVEEPLVIDPVLTYSTYLGGSGGESVYAIAVDSAGSVYVTGDTVSTNFPTAAPFQSTKGSGSTSDAFVAKLNAAGSALAYSTYLGGNKADLGIRIAVDAVGNAYVSGYTESTNFPTANSLQPAFGGGVTDAFVVKLNAAGSTLTYSTYLGGSSDDYGYGIAADGAGNAYVAGFTDSTNFPTSGSLQTKGSGFDAFVSKLNATGSAFLYSTYLGGNSNDGAGAIALDASGNAYVTGNTYSTNFPTTVNPSQASLSGESDAFVTKLNSAGSALLYSSYLGGSAYEDCFGIAVDGGGNAYVTGSTFSGDFPVASPFQPSLNGTRDAFLTKLNAAGTALVYSTFLGGSAPEAVGSVAVDGSGHAHVTGYTESGNFPTVSPLQAISGGGRDVFLVKFNPAGSGLLYATYIGGSGDDSGYGVALDSTGNAYVTGFTDSTNFLTSNPFQPTFGGGWDAFIARITDDAAPKKRRGQLISQ